MSPESETAAAPAPPPAPKTLAQRLNACMRELSYLQKDVDIGRADNKKKFRGISHDKVAGAVREVFGRHGVGFLPSVTKHEIRKVADWKGVERDHCFVDLHITVYNADDMADRMQADWSDIGPCDANGIIVATSLATKRFLLKLMLLETGEQEESRFSNGESHTDDVPSNPKAAVTNAQKLRLRDSLFAMRRSRLSMMRLTSPPLAEGEWVVQAVSTVLGKPKIDCVEEMTRFANAVEGGEVDWLTGNRAVEQPEPADIDTCPPDEPAPTAPEPLF